MSLNQRLLVLLGASLLVIGVQHCELNRQKHALTQKETVLFGELHTIDSLKNKLGQVVAVGALTRVEDQKALAALSQEVFALRKKDERRVKDYQALYRVKQNVELKEVYLPYDSTDTVVSVPPGWVAADSVVVPPKSFRDSTATYEIAGRVLLQGVQLDKISIVDTLSLRQVEVKKGLFKAREIDVQVIHSNPLVKTEGVQGITVKPKPSFWQKALPKIALVVGFVVGTQL